MDQEIRHRVNRLISGRHEKSDLDEIFLWLRPRAKGITRDLGDFIAHREERNQGISWIAAGHFVSMVRFHYEFFRSKQEDRSPKITVDDFKNCVWGAFEFISRGTKYKRARKILLSGLSKIQSIQDGQIFVETPLSQEEQKLIDGYQSIIGGQTFIFAKSVVTDMSEYLIKHNIITHSTKKHVVNQQKFVSLYLIAKLHNSKIILKDGSVCRLNISCNQENNLVILCSCPASVREEMWFAFVFFETKCKIDECVGDRLAARSLDGLNVPIELTSGGKLDLIL